MIEMPKRLLSPEHEKQLKNDLRLLFCAKELNHAEIAKKLGFGKPGPYEHLVYGEPNSKGYRKDHVQHYINKFDFHVCLPTFKKSAPSKKHRTVSGPKYKKMNRFKVAELWNNFKGTWTEFNKQLEAGAIQ